jgi:hypothetical protein
MADNTNQDNLSLEQDLIRLLQQRQGIGESILDDSRDLANVLRDQTKSVQFQIIEKNKLRSIGREIVKIADQTYAIDKKDLGTQKSIAELAKQRQTLEKSLYTLSSLKNKIYTDDKELNREINQSIGDQIKNVQELLIETGKLEQTSQNIANNFGVKMFGALSDISKAIPGLSRFSEPFNKAAEAAREVGTQNAINKKEFQDILDLNGKGLTKEKIKQLGLEKELGGLTGAAAAARAKSMGLEAKSQNTFIAGAKALGPALLKSFGPLFLAVEAFKSFTELDKTIGDTAKQLGVSYSTAAGLSQQFNSIANASGNIFITTKGINESFNQINGALGTNANLSNELLLTQTELTKQAFYSVEAATMISKLSLATDKPAKDIVTSFLGQAKALNLVNNTAINEKTLIESIAKTSKGLLATFAAQPKKLIEAAYAAKKIGLELESIQGVQDSLLNIESSIAAEFEAEVITGKQLNLERARYYALTNSISGLAQELGKQGIDQVKFAGMNVIQQEAVAKAMGLSRDQLGGMLIEQAALSKLTGGDTEENRKKLALLKEQGFSTQAIAELGQKELDNQMQSASIQDRFNTSIEKLKEIFVTLAEPLMPVLDAFAGILSVIGAVMKGVGYIFDGLNSLGPVLGKIATTLAAAALAAFMLGTSLTLGVGAAVILAAAAGGIAAYKTYMEPQAVQDGVASPNNGPFTITDKFGATAITATGDGLAVSPNIRTQPAQQSSPMIDYEKLGAHLAQAVSKVQVQTNLDGVSVSRGLQTPMGIATRKI